MQALLQLAFPQPAGVDPAPSTALHSPIAIGIPAHKGVIDSRQLSRILHVPAAVRRDACLALGSSEDRVMGDLTDVVDALNLF